MVSVLTSAGGLCEIDGRPLTVSGFSKDPDARWGYATKSHAKGFKFHSIWDAGLVPAAWEVRSMNVAEACRRRRVGAEFARRNDWLSPG